MLLEDAPSSTTLLALYALGGVLFHHLYAKRVEIDFEIWRLLGIAAAYILIASWWSLSIWKLPLKATVFTLGSCLVCFSTSLAISILIYRAFFHRLHNFRGPFAARLTSIWTVRKSTDEFKFHRRLDDLHAQYGDVVRIGPRLVSISRGDCLPQLMALNKGVWWGHTGNDPTKTSFSLSRFPEDHKQRRRPWEQAFNTQSLDKFDDGIQDVISIYLQQAKEQGVMDVPAIMGRVSFDIMGLCGYGKTFDATAKGEAHPGLVSMRKAHYVLGSLRWMPWLMNMLADLPGGGSDFVPFLNMCSKVLYDRQAQYQSDKTSGVDRSGEPRDVMSYLLEAMDAGGPAAPPTQDAMDAESRVMIAAGADTTQSVLANTLWFMAAAPSALSKLQRLLDDLFPHGPDTFSYAKLISNSEAVEWVDAIINETMRLRPAGISGNPRVTPPDGIVIPASDAGPEVWIPGDVDVLAPTWVIHRDERWFPRSKEFIPERWIGGSEDLCQKAAYFPFNIGMVNSRCVLVCNRRY